MIFQHSRFQIWNANQHVYKHSLDEFTYLNDALPGVSTVAGALNYMTAVLYPNSKPAVADPASLPLVGNTLNDMRVVSDDGDGKAATYRWEQREGDATPSWYKIYDLDWGTDSILQQFTLKTLDLYVMRGGYDDLDSAGAPVAGLYAGQRIFGGLSANTNLTLSANAGDGVGADTGYVQVTDNLRPTVDSAISLGTTTERWLEGWFDEVQSGTLVLAGGSITDTSGAISFGNENLTTSGTVTAGTLLLGTGSITCASGAISFGNENLSTTGSVTASYVSATGAASTFAAGTQIADFTFTNGNIASASATVSFNALNLSTSGAATAGQVNADNLRLDGNTLSVTNLDGALLLTSNGTGHIELTVGNTSFGEIKLNGDTRAVNSDIFIDNGALEVTGAGAYILVGNLYLEANTISSNNVNGDIILDPNGTGLVSVSSGLFPTTDSVYDLGKTGNVWNKLWLDGSIGGATEITVADLLTLRSVTFRDAGRTQAAQAGDALFWSGTQWLASAPDTEIDHGAVSGLLDDDHTQYALLAGRSGGQALIGGIAASESLDLESTAHATKGFIRFKDSLRAFTDASYSGSWSGTDVGGASNRFRHVYTAGEFFGLRFENVGANPSSSVSTRGRVVYNTGDESLYIDTGSAFKKIASNRFESDTSWNGSDTTKNVAVTGVDATKAIWQLKDNTNDYEVIYCSLKATTTTNVLITVGTPLPAGSYRLVGIE